MLRSTLFLVASTVAIAVPSSARDRSDEARLAKALAGREPGPARACISPAPSNSGGGNFGNTILTQGRDGILYRSELVGGCIARSSDALISRRPTQRLCEGDIAEIEDIAAGVPRGACSFGPFTPYRKLPRR